MPKFRRIKWAAPQATDATNQVTLVLGDGRTLTATKGQVASLNTQEKIKAAISSAFGNANDIWLHLNRNGRWAFATGSKAPSVWPEDET